MMMMMTVLELFVSAANLKGDVASGGRSKAMPSSMVA